MFETAFQAIDLDGLNARAEMLTRRDNKYVVPGDALRALAPQLAEQFEMLEIAGKRRFGYQTCYFDTGDLRSYYDHHQGRRRRCKVRVRRYLDADLCYVEVKLKDRRGITVKKRLPHQPSRLTDLGVEGIDHLQTQHRTLYGEPHPDGLQPSLQMRYRRMTLVARDGGERMTIDTDLEVWDGARAHAMAPDMFIVEAKSAMGRGLADRILRQARLHPVGSCSKYCVGLAALGRVDRHNRFLPAMRRLGMAPDRYRVLAEADPRHA